jgi:hypothetical protein
VSRTRTPPKPSPGRPEEYDWDHWKRLYARGEDWVTLEVLSSVENAPSLDSLKRHSAQERWADARKEFRHDNATKLRQLDQLNTLEIKQRQAKLGRAGQMIVAQAMANPEKIVAALRENPTALANVARTFTEMERKAAGIEELKINFSNLTDDQLERIARGEDPAKVINGA